MVELFANSGDPDQKPQNAASDLGLHCLPVTHLGALVFNGLITVLCTMVISNLFVDCLFVLRFYGPVNPVGSCRARSVYLTTRLLGRLSPPSG